MRIHNFKKTLLVCSVFGAVVGKAHSAASYFNTEGAGLGASTVGNSYCVLAAAGSAGLFTGAFTLTATSTNEIYLANDQYGITFDATNSALKSTQAADRCSTLYVTTTTATNTINYDCRVCAPVVCTGGGTLAFSDSGGVAFPLVSTLATAVPGKYASFAAYYAANPLYKSRTAPVPSTLPALLDVQKTMILDLSAQTGSVTFAMDIAVQAGETLNINAGVGAAITLTFSGAVRGGGDINVWTGAGTQPTIVWSGSQTDFSGVRTNIRAAASNISRNRVLDATVASQNAVILYPAMSATIKNGSSSENATWGAALVPVVGQITKLVVDTQNPVMFDSVSTLGAGTAGSATTAGTFAIDILKNGRVTIDVGASNLTAGGPIRSSGGGTLYLKNTVADVTLAKRTVGYASAIPYGYTSWDSFLAQNPLYYASTTTTATTVDTILDVAKSMALDLTGLTVSATGITFDWPIALQSGQTLTILTNENAGYYNRVYTFSGALRGSGNIVTRGYGIVKFTGSASDFTGSMSIEEANTTNYSGAGSNVPMQLYKPSITFTADAYSTAIDIPDNTIQLVNISGLTGAGTLSSVITGNGHLMIASGTAAAKTVRLSGNNSSWAGKLYIGDATALSYGPIIYADHANALGSNTQTSPIVVNSGMTVSDPQLLFSTSVTTARPIDLSLNVEPADAALSLGQTTSTATTILNGVISGSPTTGTSDGIRVLATNVGTIKLNAVNTHGGVGAAGAAFGTNILGGTVVMGNVSALGTGTLNDVSISGGTSTAPTTLQVPDVTGAITNAIYTTAATTDFISITMPTTAANTLTFSGGFKAGAAAGTFLRGAGAGTWNLTGTGTFVGTFKVPTGYTATPITLGSSTGFGAAGVSLSINSPTTVKMAAAYSITTAATVMNAALTLNCNGFDTTFTSPITGTAQFTKAASTDTLTLGSASSAFTLPMINLGGTVKSGGVISSSATYLGLTGQIYLGSSTATSQSSVFEYSAGSRKITNTTAKQAWLVNAIG